MSTRVVFAEMILLAFLCALLVTLLSPVMGMQQDVAPTISLGLTGRDVLGLFGIGGLCELGRRALKKLDNVSGKCDDTHTTVQTIKVELVGLTGTGGLIGRYDDLCDDVSELQRHTGLVDQPLRPLRRRSRRPPDVAPPESEDVR